MFFLHNFKLKTHEYAFFDKKNLSNDYDRTIHNRITLDNYWNSDYTCIVKLFLW